MPRAIERDSLLTGADLGNVQLLDPRRQVLRVVAHRGFEPSFLSSRRPP
jgi:hypothetical protein